MIDEILVNKLSCIEPKIKPGEDKAYKKAIIRLVLEELEKKND
jgi:hypothetical protein